MLCFFRGLKLKKWIEIHTEVVDLSEYKDFLNDTKKQLLFNDSACFGYKRNDVADWSSPTPFVEHNELQNDFLNYIEVVGNIWDNKISELVSQHSI